MLLNMPIDHHTLPSIPHMPFSHQILVPRPKLCGVRGTRRCSFSPDLRLTHLKNSIGNINNSCPQMLLIDKAAAGVNQLIMALSMISLTNALYTHIRSYCIDTQ